MKRTDLADSTRGTYEGLLRLRLPAFGKVERLDDHLAELWEANQFHRLLWRRRRYRGLANCRLVHYVDDFVVLVSGTRAHAVALREEVAAVLAPRGIAPFGSENKDVPDR